MSGQEDQAFSRFFQYVEESGLGAYDRLVIQNASDIARESDRLRDDTNWAYLQEKHKKKRRQDEVMKRMGEDVVRTVDAGYVGKHFRLGFLTLPAPQDRLPPPCNQGFSVRSQSLHSVGGGDQDGGSNSRKQTNKQPPPKPRRDPNTKLSMSSERVSSSGAGSHSGRDLDSGEGSRSRPFSEEYKRIPPTKPKRNPNTQLSTSFDESYGKSTRKGSRRDMSSSHSQSQSPDRDDDRDGEEPVYIEMVGNILRDFRRQEKEEEEQSEAVYEEMKYPLSDDTMHDSYWEQGGPSLSLDPEPGHTSTTMCHIPVPFPNLLTQRAPLLVFPPAPAQCSPNSGDESPLTPMDLSRLPMLDNSGFAKTESMSAADHTPTSSFSTSSSSRHRKAEQERDRERETELTVTPSGRSSAPPLLVSLYKSPPNSQGHHGYSRSHSACPSPVTVARCLTPLSLQRSPHPPPYPAHGSPLDELTNLLASGRGTSKKSSGARKNKGSAESEARSRSWSQSTEALPRHDSKERGHHHTGGREAAKAQEWDGSCGLAAHHHSLSLGRASLSPTTMITGGSTEPRAVCKLGRSASTSGVHSPSGTPQRQPPPAAAPPACLRQGWMGPVPWPCGDSTMLETIEKKRSLCREIKARQRLDSRGQRADRSLCKQDSMPILPSWRKYGPPPYASHTTVLWDSAI